MAPIKRSLVTATAAVILAGAAAVAAASPGDAAPPPAGKKNDLEAAIAAASVFHGTFTVRYRLRTTQDATDQDLYEYLDLHVGDETKDVVSGSLFARAAEDLDHAHQDDPGFVFGSLDDTFDHSVNALLYTAYATVRPRSGPFESLRFGRQYVVTAETLHVDGASATTRPLVESIQLKLTAYGGVPVHFYESSPAGDWLAGLRLAADPWKGAHAALDYTHDQDRFSMLGTQPKNDLAAISVWQQVARHADVFGQFTWLDGPRDATLRGTVAFPESDFLVQASYYRLLETQRELATEFDPYTTILQDLVGYHQADLRVSKGLGENVDVEAGVMERRLLPGETESAFNHDTRRIWLTPTLSDLPWKGTSVSVTGESLAGNGEEIRTWGVDLSHRFTGRLTVSAGSDYSLYAFGPLGTDERSHVRTAYARVKFPLAKSLSADVKYTWEKDDVETFHVLTLALVLDF